MLINILRCTGQSPQQRLMGPKCLSFVLKHSTPIVRRPKRHMQEAPFPIEPVPSPRGLWFPLLLLGEGLTLP